MSTKDSKPRPSVPVPSHEYIARRRLEAAPAAMQMQRDDQGVPSFPVDPAATQQQIALEHLAFQDASQGPLVPEDFFAPGRPQRITCAKSLGACYGSCCFTEHPWAVCCGAHCAAHHEARHLRRLPEDAAGVPAADGHGRDRLDGVPLELSQLA